MLLQHAGAGTRRICVRKRESVRERMCAMRWNSLTKNKIGEEKKTNMREKECAQLELAGIRTRRICVRRMCVAPAVSAEEVT